MGNINWNKVETIVDQVLDLPQSERVEHIQEVCAGNDALEGEVTRLLNSIFDSEGWLDDPKEFKEGFYQEMAQDVEEVENSHSLIGKTIGSYTIKELLGEGGMGQVYLAERSDGTFEHKVAIKILRSARSSPENIRRFKQERNILAGLNHPGIAKLFDGGITDNGLQYLIMEYIDGKPITTYCQDNNLSLDERIKLFRKVLSAVQHAHESLVIHRDLKPDNIFVTPERQIKILDFGISKLLENTESSSDQTLSEGRMLTPKYAAPEQIREEQVTTATDVYALGIIFYELLSGKHPYDLNNKSYFETEKLILNKVPLAPSANTDSWGKQHRTTLRGDLDAIALKAIDKDHQERYRMANQFLSDLVSFEQGLPVTAQANSLTYRAKKFINRNKLSIAVTGIFLFLIVSISIFHTSRLTQERNRAQLEAEKAVQIKELFSEILQQSDPFTQPDRDISLSEVLATGTDKLKSSLDSQPQVKAELLGLLGGTFASLGNFEKGEELLQEALALDYPLELKTERQTYINNLTQLGRIYHRIGRFKESESTYLKALEMSKRLHGEESGNLAGIYISLASIYREEGHLLKTEEFYKNAIELSDSTHKLLLATSLGNLAIAYRDQGEYEKALNLHDRSLKLEHEVHDSLHPDIASGYNNLAFTYQQMGKYQAADSLHQIALSMRRELFPSDHHHIASSLVRLGLLKIKQMHTGEAEKYLAEGYKILNQKLPEDHWQLISARGGLAVSRAMQGEFEENVPIVEEAYNFFYDRFGEDDWRTHEAAAALTNLYRIWGKTEKADFYSEKL